MAMKTLTTAVFALLALAAPALAQSTYPDRPVRLIVPFAAGGTTDLVARMVAEGMRQVLGQQVVVENVAGGGGTVGTEAIAKATPDGYTIGVGTASALTINPAVQKNLPYAVPADFTTIGNIAVVPNIMSIHPSVPAKDVAAFVTFAKANPGKLSYGSAGVGSVGHLLGEQFNLAEGTDVQHVPYRGAGPALVDAVAGQVEVMYDNLPTTLPMVLDGRLRAMAVSGEARSPALPDVPTFTELGLADMNWMAFYGLIGPAGLPDTVVERLNKALVGALAKPDIHDKLAAQQARVVGDSPEAFRAYIEQEGERMRGIVTAAGIKLD